MYYVHDETGFVYTRWHCPNRAAKHRDRFPWLLTVTYSERLIPVGFRDPALVIISKGDS